MPMLELGNKTLAGRSRRVGVLVAFVALAAGFTAAADPAPGSEKCEFGITLALEGQLAASESVFVSLLSDLPADARALNNLGNISCLRGDLDVALVFYERSLEADSTDPGVQLNRATTLMLNGEEERAKREAGRAIRMAGGVKQLAALTGIGGGEDQGDQPAKASDKVFVDKQEVRDLLRGAMVPLKPQPAAADSAASRTTPPPEASKKRARLWKSAAPRASDASQAALVLYWKR